MFYEVDHLDLIKVGITFFSIASFGRFRSQFRFSFYRRRPINAFLKPNRSSAAQLWYPNEADGSATSHPAPTIKRQARVPLLRGATSTCGKESQLVKAEVAMCLRAARRRQQQTPTPPNESTPSK